MKKCLKRIGLGLLAVVVLLYAFVFLRSVMPVTVNDQDLKLERRNVPEGSNAFPVLQTAATHVWWPKDQNDQIFDLVRNTNWDNTLASTVLAALASTVLANNREALAGWDAAAKLPDLQVPEVHHADDLVPYLSEWKKLAQVAAIQENLLMCGGQDREAFDQIISHIQLGRRMQNTHGVLIVYQVGSSVKNMGLAQLRYWSAKTKLTPQQLKNYIRQIEPDTTESSDAYANTLRSEYQLTLCELEDIRMGRVVDEEGKSIPRPSIFLPTINYSRARAKFAKAYQMLIAAAPGHYSQAKLPNLENRPGPVSLIFSGNLAGDLMYFMLMPAVVPSFANKVHGDVSQQATCTLLALRAYQMQHGKLPSDLNALVPEFLSAVPVDDFDGQPLRYSPEKKIVYSVGKNLKDDGGDDRGSEEKEYENRHLDLVYPIEF